MTWPRADVASAQCVCALQVRRVLADLGCKALLKMMLSDNFVHADLHPGNILVRMDAPVVGTGLLGSLLPRRLRRPRPHIVLLDCGMTATLSDRNKHNLYRFFEARALTWQRGVCLRPCVLTLRLPDSCAGDHSGRRALRGGDGAGVQRAPDVSAAAGVRGRPGGPVQHRRRLGI